jgi:RIO-like serine/threonine protein kinase
MIPIGVGEAATVYKTMLSELPAAIKVYGCLQRDADKANHEVSVYQRLSSVQGICVPRLLASGSTVMKGHFLVALEFVDGAAMAAPVPPDQQKAVLGALRAIHAQGVMHGDLKPANILVTTDGSIRFIDFERACITDADHQLRQEDAALRLLVGLS